MIVDRRPNRIVYEPGAPCGEYLAFWLMEELLASAVPSGLGCDTFLLVGGRGDSIRLPKLSPSTGKQSSPQSYAADRNWIRPAGRVWRR